MYKENPKTKGSGIICAIPQTGTCPNECEDCFFQSGRSYLEPLEENLPNMPSQLQADGKVVRINDGNDSNVRTKDWIIDTDKYPMKFFNTAIPDELEKFNPDPVVLTVNPMHMTDNDAHLIDCPENLMFVRFRANMWNRSLASKVVDHYSICEVPIVMTFMAYFNKPLEIQNRFYDFYTYRKRTLNSYHAITTNGWETFMEPFRYNKWVYSCGKIEGEKGTTACRHCGIV